jgi:predicted enzyme related to lactoylglutathione lyase
MSRVYHFEVHASDPQRTMNFYTQLFGWRFEPWGPPDTYWLIKTGPVDQPGIDGGVVPRRGAPPTEGQAVNAFVCTVDVANAAESLAKAIALGGSEALPVMAIPGVGWLAYAKDPEGTIFGMMQQDTAAA